MEFLLLTWKPGAQLKPPHGQKQNGRKGHLLEKGEGIISTAGFSFHPTNHTNIWHSFSSETLAGLCLARQFSMCWTAHSVFIKGSKHCGTKILTFVKGKRHDACFIYTGSQWRRKEICCAKSYNEIILLSKQKHNRPDLSHTKLGLVCICCMRIAGEG